MSSTSIITIMSYTVSRLVHFFEPQCKLALYVTLLFQTTVCSYTVQEEFIHVTLLRNIRLTWHACSSRDIVYILLLADQNFPRCMNTISAISGFLSLLLWCLTIMVWSVWLSGHWEGARVTDWHETGGGGCHANKDGLLLLFLKNFISYYYYYYYY